MVYRKYIKRNGKTYGPYLYHNTKKNGRVITSYHGKGKSPSSHSFFSPLVATDKRFWMVVGFLVLLVGALLVNIVFLVNTALTGKVSVDVEQVYQTGETLRGDVRLVLQHGEFFPADTQVIVDNSGETYTYILRDLIGQEAYPGDFYVEGSTLSGQGEGYGTVGQQKIYPEVTFSYRVVPKTASVGGGDSGGSSKPSSESEHESTSSVNASDQPSANDTIPPASETSPESQNDTSSETDSLTVAPSASLGEDVLSEGSTVQSSDESSSVDTVEPPSESASSEPSSEATADSSSDSSGETAPSDTSTSSSQESSSDSSASDSGESSSSSSSESSSSDSPSDSSGGAVITGEAITDDSSLLVANTSRDAPFALELASDEAIEVVYTTAPVKVRYEGTTVIVETDYSEIAEGFGEEYVTPDTVVFPLSFDALGIVAKQGTLTLSFVYDEIILVDVQTPIEVLSANDSVIAVNDTNETIPVDNETMPAINNATNATNVTRAERIDKALLGKPFVLDSDLRERILQGEKPRVLFKVRNGGRSFGEKIGSLSYEVAMLDLTTLEALDSDVLEVIVDRPVSLFATETDGLIRSSLVRSSFGLSGSGQRVCLVDTGVDSSVVSYEGGYDFVEGDSLAQDEHGHGTEVAFILKTVAPGTGLYVAKVVNSQGESYESDVLLGLDWCSQQNVGVVMISMGAGSYAGYCDGEVVSEEVNALVDSGIVVVVATGNDAASTLAAPSCASGALRVAASTKQDAIASFSNVNSLVSVLAPGENIVVQTLGGTARTVSGTSFSVPFVAGASAFLLEHESLTPDALRTRLRSTGVGISFSSTTLSRLDVYNAILNNVTLNLSEEEANQSEIGNETNYTLFDIISDPGDDACYYTGTSGSPDTSSTYCLYGGGGIGDRYGCGVSYTSCCSVDATLSRPAYSTTMTFENSGTQTFPNCCGDDTGERTTQFYYQTSGAGNPCDTTTYGVCSSAGSVCCYSLNAGDEDCMWNGQCYSDTSVVTNVFGDGKAVCLDEVSSNGGSRWYDCDYNSYTCNACGYGGKYNIGGGSCTNDGNADSLSCGTECCGDDPGEFTVTCTVSATTAEFDTASCTTGTACCDKYDFSGIDLNKCVYNDVCYNPQVGSAGFGAYNLTGLQSDELSVCNAGQWYDCDDGAAYCTGACQADGWNLGNGNAQDGVGGAESPLTRCCGDDPGESGASRTISPTCNGNDCPPFSSSAGDVACCAEDSCIYNGACYVSSSQDKHLVAGENLFCGSKTWYDCDESSVVCSLACGYTWAVNGEVGVIGEYESAGDTECCGDDANEFLLGGVGTPSSACCSSADNCVADGACYEPQGIYTNATGNYSCESGSWIAVEQYDTCELPLMTNTLIVTSALDCSDITLNANSLRVLNGATFRLTNVDFVVGETLVEGTLFIRNSASTIWQNDNLTISGTYALENTTLRLNGSSVNGSLGILVTPGATFLANSSSRITHGSDDGFRYFMNVSETATLSLNDSFVEYAGWDYQSGNLLTSGIVVYADDAFFDNVTFAFNHRPIIVGNSARVVDATFAFNNYGLSLRGNESVLSQSVFHDNVVGANILGFNNSISQSSFYDNNDGITFFLGGFGGNVLQSVLLANNTQRGIYDVMDSGVNVYSPNVLYNVSAQGNNRGVLFSSNTSVYDSSFSGNVQTDVYSSGILRSNVFTALNTSFDSLSFFTDVPSKGRVETRWYVDFSVHDAVGSVAGANVSVFNASDALIFSELTNATGQLDRKILVGFIENVTQRTNATPYMINVTKEGYVPFNDTFELNKSFALDVVLEKMNFPFVETLVLTPTSAYTKDTLDCTFNITDVDSPYLNVTIDWYRDGSFVSTQELNYSSGSLEVVSYPSTETRHGDVYFCNVSAVDELAYFSGYNVSGSVSILTYPTTIAIVNDTGIARGQQATFTANYSSDILGDLQPLVFETPAFADGVQTVEFFNCYDGHTCFAVGKRYVGIGDLIVYNYTGVQMLSANIGTVTDMLSYDFDFDGNEELVVGTQNRVSVYYSNATLKWEDTTVGNIDYVAVGDVDGDGFVDILTANGGTGQNVSAFNFTGERLWSFNTGINRNLRGLVFANFSGGGRVGYGQRSGGAGILNSTGAQLFVSGTETVGDVNVVNLDGDSYDEFLVGGSPSGGFAAYDDDGTYLWQIGQVSDNVKYEVDVADLDFDGTPEILYGDGDHLLVYHATAGGYTQQWNFTRVVNDTTPAYFVFSLLTGDFNDDRVSEVFFGGSMNRTYVLNASGDLQHEFLLGSQLGASTGAAYGGPGGRHPALDLGDFNSDGVSEILMGSYLPENKVFMYQEVSCAIAFNDSVVSTMVWNDTLGLWRHNRSFSSSGEYTYNVTCSKGGYIEQVASSSIWISPNTLPVVTLLSPENNTMTTNRTLNFTWQGFDLENDPLTYEFNLTCHHELGGGCSTYGSDDRLITTSDSFYTLTDPLKYLYDNQYYYTWTVRAYDGVSWGFWADPWNLFVQSSISIRLANNAIDFGVLTFNQSESTDDGTPSPFVLENDGNARVNVTMNATDLWQSTANPTTNFLYRFTNVTGEAGSFNWLLSTTAWTPVPNSITSGVSLSGLNWSDATDAARIDVNVTVPGASEGAGQRSSQIQFVASLDE